MFLFVGLGLIAKRALPSLGLDLARERVVDVHVVVVLQVVVVVGALPTRGTGCTALAREPKPASKPHTRDAPCSSRSCTCSRTMTRRSSIGKPSTLGPCFQPEGINALGIGHGAPGSPAGGAPTYRRCESYSIFLRPLSQKTKPPSAPAVANASLCTGWKQMEFTAWMLDWTRWHLNAKLYGLWASVSTVHRNRIGRR